MLVSFLVCSSALKMKAVFSPETSIYLQYNFNIRIVATLVWEMFILR
jgi:hypothetical protein